MRISVYACMKHFTKCLPDKTACSLMHDVKAMERQKNYTNMNMYLNQSTIHRSDKSGTAEIDFP